MNKLIIKGLMIETTMSYIRMDKSITRSIIEDPITKVLIINFIDGDLNSSIVYSGITIIDDITLETLSVTMIVNQISEVNGVKFTKLVLDDIIITQIVTPDITPRLIEYNPFRLNLYVNDTVDQAGYVAILNSMSYIEVLDSTGYDPAYYSVNNIKLTKYDRKIEGSLVVPFSPKSNYVKYIMDEVLCLYQVKLCIHNLLKPHGFNILIEDDYDEEITTNDYLTYSHQSSNMEVVKKNPSGFASNYFEINLPVKWTLRTPSISKATYFRDKYNNLNIISNSSSLIIKDYNDKDYRVAVTWNIPAESNIGHKDSRLDDKGNYSYVIDFTCMINYGVLFGDVDYVFITKINKMLNVNNYIMNNNVVTRDPNGLSYGELLLIINDLSNQLDSDGDVWDNSNI